MRIPIFILLVCFSFSYHSQVNYVDSLFGFDSTACVQAAEKNGCFGNEQTVFLQRAKHQFISNKFHTSLHLTSARIIGNGLTIANAPCIDEGFEGLPIGNLISTAWISEASNSASATSVPCNSPSISYSVNNSQAILVNTPVVDPLCNNVGGSPLGGLNILQLNKNNLNTRPSRIRQTFSVTATNNFYHYAYKGVLNTAGSHSCCEQPALYFNFYDCSGNLISSLQNAILSASCNTSADAAYWNLSSNGYYTTPNWVLNTVDLSAYIGSCVTAEVLAVGCIYTGHEGYLYYDALCSASASAPSLTIIYANSLPVSTYSTCAQPVVLSSVSGLSSYTWQGPAGSGVSSSTLSQVTASVSGIYTLTATQASVAITQTLAVTIHSLPAVSIAGPTIYCASNIATLQAIGAAASYYWSTGSTSSVAVIGPSMSAQMFLIVTSINGCSLNLPYIIQADYPAYNTVSATKTLICTGNNTTLSCQHNGTSVLWNNGVSSATQIVTPVTSSYYSAQVSNAGGCITSDSIYLQVVPLPTLQISVTNTVMCQFKSLYIGANASPQTTISWSTGDVGAYTFPVMVQTQTIVAQATNSNNCKATAICIASVNPRPSYTLSQLSPTACEGDTISFAVTNLTIPGTYLWSTGATGSMVTLSPSTAIAVNVTVTSVNGCSLGQSLYYSPFPRSGSVTIQQDDITICLGRTVYLDAFYYNILSFGWSTGDSTSSISFAPTNSATYTFSGEDLFGCKYSDTIQINVDPCTSLLENTEAGKLTIAPNPSASTFLIKGTTQTELHIYDVSGKTIVIGSLNPDNNYEYLFSPVENGVYLLKSKYGNFKVVKI